MDKRPEVRQRAITILFDILGKNTFSNPFWEVIYDLILDYIPKTFLHLLEEDPKNSDYVQSALFSTLNVFAEKYEVLEKHSKEIIERVGHFISPQEEVKIFNIKIFSM